MLPNADPFLVMNSLPPEQVDQLVHGRERTGPRLVRSPRRTFPRQAFAEMQHRGDRVDFGQEAGAYDSPANQRSRFQLYSSLPNRQHTGIVLLDQQIDSIVHKQVRKQNLRFGLCIGFATLLLAGTLSVVLR